VFPSVLPRWLLVTGLVLLLAGGAAIWLWRSAGSSTPVSEESALESFREGAGAAAGPRPGVPRAGVYTYRQSGRETGGAGPLSVTRDLPDQARYVVTPASEGYEEQLSLSEQHIEGVRYRVTDAGTLATWRRTDVTFLGIGRDDRRDLRPPQLRLPRPVTVGRTWSGRYTAGDLPVSYRSEALRREPVQVGADPVPAVVVRTVADTGGPHPGTRTDTIWWSPRLALPVRWTIEMEIRGAVSLDTRADLRLASVTPLT
jgi:hypothetical protein